MMRHLLDANYRTYGVLVMELNTDTLFASMRSVIWMTDATVWLGDAEYTVAGLSLIHISAPSGGGGRQKV